ncbi:MAG: 4'-phosphopantetheinyl transferase superfamily protein [Bacteroidota bacterium]
MIKTYYANFFKPVSDQRFEYYLSQLPTSIRDKILRYRRWEDAHASLFGKLLLVKALKEHGLAYDLTSLQYTAFDRPFLDTSFDFNITHSGNYVACVFSESLKVGIDMEEIRPIPIDDFHQQFTEKELAEMKNSTNPMDRFYHYWTIKEAIIKADGKGLSIPLKQIYIQGDRATVEGGTWYLKSLSIDPGYKCHLATNQLVSGEVNIEKVDFG